MKVVGWFYPKDKFIKKTNSYTKLFIAILSNEEHPPFTIQMVCWGEKAVEVSTKVRYGMV